MTVTAIESLLTVRRAIHIKAPPERVWEEFETFERMASWWGTGHRLVIYEPRQGGRIEMEVEVDGTLRRFGGAITVFEPGRELTFEDNWTGPMAWPAPVMLTLRLTPALDGTIVELIEHGFERMGEQAAEIHSGLEGGWSVRQLAALRRIVEGA
jgi:uncharacterized protein YndB with AHSA1/START domain